MNYIDPALVKKLRAEIRGILQFKTNGMAFFDINSIEKSENKIVMVECDFKDADGIISNACRKWTLTSGYCFSAQELVPDIGYSICLDHAELSTVHSDFVSPSYIVMERERKFIIVSDSDYYWAVAAHENFLRTVFSETPLIQLEKFKTGIAPYVSSKIDDNKKIGALLMEFCQISETTWA